MSKPVGLICDNYLYLKPLAALEPLLHDNDRQMQPPYDGAKPHYVITDVDDRDYLSQLVKKVALYRRLDAFLSGYRTYPEDAGSSAASCHADRPIQRVPARLASGGSGKTAPRDGYAYRPSGFLGRSQIGIRFPS